MRSILTFLLFLLLIPALHCPAQTGGDRILSPASMQEDFTYLRKMLENTHPGLYMHNTPAAMQHKMDSLYGQLNEPLSFFDFYKKIAFLIAETRCEHTYCGYGKKFDSLVMTFKLFPLQLYFPGGKALVTVNRTRDTDILPGDELVSINGYPVDSIRQELYKYIPSDGYMLPSKDQQLSSMAFNLWYYFFIERPDHFDAMIRNKSGQVIHRHWDKELTLKESNENAMKNPANKEIFAIDKKRRKLRKDPWRIEILKEKQAAIITIHDFTGEKDKFFKTIDRFFNTLQAKHISNLIIDISDNGGGDEEYAAELMSYLVDKPTRFMESEYLLTDSDAYLKLANLPDDVLENKYDYIEPLKEGRSIVKLSKYSQELKTMEPKPNRFTGKIYLYVNGITSSAASTFAAVAQSNGLAEIVGEETAGSFAGGGTVIGLNLTLPNSRITAHTSIVYQVFATKGRDKDRGVVPDHPFVPSFTDLTTRNDGWRDFIFQLIKK